MPSIFLFWLKLSFQITAIWVTEACTHLHAYIWAVFPFPSRHSAHVPAHNGAQSSVRVCVVRGLPCVCVWQTICGNVCMCSKEWWALVQKQTMSGQTRTNSHAHTHAHKQTATHTHTHPLSAVRWAHPNTALSSLWSSTCHCKTLICPVSLRITLPFYRVHMENDWNRS